MTQERWTAVDHYLDALYQPPDSVLDSVLKAAAEGGLPAHQVAPNQGKLLMMLAKMIKAKSILEIGTLGAYSTIWMARALPPSGRIITLEVNPAHAEVARSNLVRAGFADRVEVRVGHAIDSLNRLLADGYSFDLVFIDADKVNNVGYLERSRKLTHPGSLIIGDNVVRGGDVIDAESTDPSVIGARDFNTLFANTPGVVATALQTVGSKGYDGFAIGLVL